MADLYEDDVLLWSERQVALLRRIAAGEQINDQVDWENVIKEIESIGQSQVDAVESWPAQAFLHDLKAKAWPLSPDAPHWRAEARLFRRQVRRKYSTSMRQKTDVAGLYSTPWQVCPRRSKASRHFRCRMCARSRSMSC